MYKCDSAMTFTLLTIANNNHNDVYPGELLFDVCLVLRSHIVRTIKVTSYDTDQTQNLVSRQLH
jgi:hypothetical protein